MNKKKKIFTTLSITLISMLFLAAAIISATQAWFTLVADYIPTWKSSSEGAYFAYGNGKARAEGSENEPYGITRPIHLYNLAWLQYLGYFDINDVDDEYSLDNVRFELAADIDMTGWTLPPIGTKTHPFIGNFNGNGYKITNLTVSNDLNDYNRIPFGITRNDFPNNVNIVGLFGVVGKYESNAIASYNTQANEITNTGISGLTVASKSTTTLAGLAAGYLNGNLEGVAVNNSNIDLSSSGGSAISGLTNNVSDYSLIGYAASDDYLGKLQFSTTTHTTPTISNPFLSQGGNEWGGSIEMKEMYNTLHEKMENSNYYTFSNYLTEQEQTRRDNGDGTYTPSSGYTIDPDKNVYGNDTTIDSANGEYFYKCIDTGTKNDNTPVQTASYTFAADNNKNNLSSYKYVGLSGEKSLGTYTYTLKSSTIKSQNGLKYYDSNANMYLTTTNGTSLTGTSAENASVWFLDNSNHLYTNIQGTNYYLNSTNGNLTLGNNGTSTWTYNSTTHTLNVGTYNLSYSGGWIMTDTSNAPNPTTYSSYLADSYQIFYNGHYMSRASTTSTGYVNQITSANTYGWRFESTTTNSDVSIENATTVRVYTIYNNTKYYLYDNGTRNNSYKLGLTTTASQREPFTVTKNSNGTYRLQADDSGGTYYLTCDTGNSVFSTRSAQSNSNLYCDLTIATTQSILQSYTNSSIMSVEATADIKTTTSTSTTKNHNTLPTYYPLTWDDDSINPAEKNTGYVVAGHNYENTSNYSIGDIRISSYYDTSMLSGSFITSNTGYTNKNIFAYTYNSDGDQVKIGDEINEKKNASGYTSYETLGYKKYYYSLLGRASGSRVSLGSQLGESGTNIAYGLHFMNSDISMDRIINVPYAKINGDEKINYDLPMDSIDFNLKTDGFINFFAATYFVNTSNGNTNWNNSNNSFFSLHWIDRNQDNDDCSIDSIKQIAKIYKNTEYTEENNTVPKYVYTYRNSSDEEVTSYFDTGLRNSNGTIITGEKGDLVFDTYWLTDPEYSKFTLKALYYFEIPVNKGEFALGSTSGKTKRARGWGSNNTQYNKNGAYLLYLDIGASIKNTNGITIEDTSSTITEKFKYPVGVDFKTISSSTTGDYSNVLGGESSAIIIPSGTKQNITYDYTPKSDNKALLSVGPEGGGGSMTAVYKTVGTEVKNKTGTDLVIEEASSSSTDLMEREILYDLRDFVEGTEITPTISIVHTIDGVKSSSQDTNGIPITFTQNIINSIGSFEVDTPINLYTVEYSNTINSAETNITKISSTYNVLTKTYTISFVNTETGKISEISFIYLNLVQSHTENNQTINDTYILVVQNNDDGSTPTQVGTISSSDIDKLITIICLLQS